MPTSIDSEADFEVGRPTEHRDWTNTTLEEPTASRKTLARRLRAVERALGGVEGIEEFEPAVEQPSTPDDLDAVEERLVALERAVRAIGEHLVERERAHRTENGLESVTRSVEELADSGYETDPNDDGSAVRELSLAAEESPAEWLDRVAAGGVTPPPVE